MKSLSCNWNITKYESGRAMMSHTKNKKKRVNTKFPTTIIYRRLKKNFVETNIVSHTYLFVLEYRREKDCVSLEIIKYFLVRNCVYVFIISLLAIHKAFIQKLIMPLQATGLQSHNTSFYKLSSMNAEPRLTELTFFHLHTWLQGY